MSPQMSLQSQNSAKLGIKREMPETSSKHPSKGIQITFLQRSAAIRDMTTATPGNERRLLDYGALCYYGAIARKSRMQQIPEARSHLLGSKHRIHCRDAAEVPVALSRSLYRLGQMHMYYLSHIPYIIDANIPNNHYMAYNAS